jgi:iron complex transport system ATP-binding protein
VLGERSAPTDVATLRRRASATRRRRSPPSSGPTSRPLDVVMTARYAALEPWWHRYDDADRERRPSTASTDGRGRLADRPLGTLSSGEQQRVLLARTLMNDPAVVLLDEPSARLDLGGREQLVAALDDHRRRPGAPPFVLVTHHVDEVPPGTTHALLLRDGRALAQGPIDEVLTADSLSECFAMPLALERRPTAGSRRGRRR